MLKFLFRQIYKNKQIIKYLIAGGTAAFIDLFLLYIFTDVLGLWYLHSAVIAFILAFFVSFSLQKFWTFRDSRRDRLPKQVAVYFIVAGANLGINAGGMFILVDRFHILYLWAQIIMGALIAVESFLIYKFFIFKKQHKESEIKPAKIRVLIATGIYPPDIGGPATYAKPLAEELQKLGCEVKIVTYGEKIAPKNSSESLYVINKDRNILLRYFKYFSQIWKLAPGADIIYILDLVSAGFPATVAANLKGKKVIFRTGGDFLWEKAFNSGWTELPLVDYYKARKSIKEKLLLYFCRSILEAIDIVIFSSNLQKNIYRNYYNLEGEKIKLISNAIPFVDLQEAEENSDSIVFAGRLIRLKNIERLISAFNNTKRGETKLLIFGDGPYREKLEKKISELNLKDKVLMKGAIEHSCLLKVIAGCKFVILPSITEISPNLALECISLDKPIILTKNNGLNSGPVDKIIKVDPLSEDDIREKIDYLLEPANLADYKNKIKEINLERREWREVAEEHSAVFNELIKK